ncbi:hypothetical protein pdam_00016374 [Pocillopora damicornis]|uniref:Uncharacterized protein n=1 Tax=Pocillopora damicornis TaxID=46731 RepID=A0A3M6V0C9_POCDA|nr:hypothetical protein pdam_00016374 [Pocillopora damicornis]
MECLDICLRTTRIKNWICIILDKTPWESDELVRQNTGWMNFNVTSQELQEEHWTKDLKLWNANPASSDIVVQNSTKNCKENSMEDMYTDIRMYENQCLISVFDK